MSKTKHPLCASFFENAELILANQAGIMLREVVQQLKKTEPESMENALEYSCAKAYGQGGADNLRFASILFRVTAVLPKGNRQGAMLVPAVFAESNTYLRTNFHEIVQPVINRVYAVYVSIREANAVTESGAQALRASFIAASRGVHLERGPAGCQRAFILDWLFTGPAVEVEALLQASTKPAIFGTFNEAKRNFQTQLFDHLWTKAKGNPTVMAAVVDEVILVLEENLRAAFNAQVQNHRQRK